ncbi:N-acetylmuramoyl-L-alanine amidase [Rhodococcus daqingensis]|uniref:N-acetylmuramoyl-L-alanine amidase n=1 Tax=Rhodococcus daqingensis TaxID=2479363 RepID=A0ABW2RUG4_9NOCA
MGTWTGDPVWLEEVLRPVLGDRLKTLPGWQNRGHGDFRDIRGVMVHHTGNKNETAESIKRGRPDLAGPLANLHIAPDGTVTIVAVGVCWHAGKGSYPWLPTNNANPHMIGIECAWPTITGTDARGEPTYDAHELWPDAQIISMRDTCAALALKLGVGADKVIGHKEYAGAAQGKWDPGNIDMNWFRGEVAKDMRGEFEAAPPVVVPPPAPVAPPILPPPPNPRSDRVLLEEIWTALRGPDGNGWPQLGGKTVVDYLADLLQAQRDGGASPDGETADIPAMAAPARKATARKAPAKKAAKRAPAKVTR